ncbi:MAG: NAD(P)H-hydrate epimerase [Phycisphaerales bacterium]
MAARWPVPAVDAAGARALDAQARDRFGVATRLLMENAGAECARLAGKYAGHARHIFVEVWCGPGGNGGDGYVCARHLAVAGVPVRVRAVGAPRAGTDAADARRAWRAIARTAPAPPAGARCVLVVDALLGTGLRAAPTGRMLAAVRAINARRDAGARVLAVDLPSGLDADTGDAPGEAVRAHGTAMIAAPKRGLLRPAARRFTGRLLLVHFGAPGALRASRRG